MEAMHPLALQADRWRHSVASASTIGSSTAGGSTRNAAIQLPSVRRYHEPSAICPESWMVAPAAALPMRAKVAPGPDRRFAASMTTTSAVTGVGVAVGSNNARLTVGVGSGVGVEGFFSRRRHHARLTNSQFWVAKDRRFVRNFLHHIGKHPCPILSLTPNHFSVTASQRHFISTAKHADRIGGRRRR